MRAALRTHHFVPGRVRCVVFCGFLTRGFALIAENPSATLGHAPAVESPSRTTNLPDSALDRVRSVKAYCQQWPLALSTVEDAFRTGRFSLPGICVDDATLFGVPALKMAYHLPRSVV